MSDLDDKPKHLEIQHDGKRTLVHSPVAIPCGGCKKMAFFFVNALGVTLCASCHHGVPALEEPLAK